MPLDVVETVCELVRLPSVNPMGRDARGEEFFEHRVTDYLERLFQRSGLPCLRQPISQRRDNIIALLEGSPSLAEGGQLLMLEAHQDTVPVEGMTIAPWDPQIRDGRIYGRGACDVKGGMACILAAVSRLAEDRPPGMATVLVACTVNEEYGFSGAMQLPRIWQGDGAQLVPRPPDAAVVMEPTALNVVVAHKGALRWRLQTFGRAAHSSRPELGDNAIYAMAQVLTAIQEYAQTVLPGMPRHPLLGSPTLSVGRIEGGISVNTVPDRCEIEIDRRLLPNETAQPALAHIRGYLQERLGWIPEIISREPEWAARGLSDRDNREIADRLATVLQRVTGSGERAGVPYGTNAPNYAAAGVPTVVFGPGSIDQAHTADEWIAIDQLHAATEALYQLARG